MRTLLLAALAAFALAACGQQPTENVESADPVETPILAAPAIALVDPWAATSPAGAATAAGYMTITNAAAEADRLVSASSPRAASVELHEMAMEGAMMTMRPFENGVDIPAAGEAAFAPGGAHLMFIGVTAPFVEGETIPVTLVFERAGPIEAALPVRPRPANGAH